MKKQQTDNMDAWDEILELGFRTRVVSEPNGSGTKYYCLGTLAFRVHVDVDDETQKVTTSVIIVHAEWDSDAQHADFYDRLTAADLDALSTVLPALQRITKEKCSK